MFATNSSVHPGEPGTMEWLRASGADILAVGTADQTPTVQGFDLLSIEAPADAWENMPPQDVVWNWSLMRERSKPESLLAAAPDHPGTFLFHTREDGFGLLQVLSATNPEPSVKIRYKLAQAASARQP